MRHYLPCSNLSDHILIGNVMNSGSMEKYSTGKLVDEDAVEKLASGLVSIYHPKLMLVKGQLHELTEKHKLLLNDLHAENLKFSEARYSVDLHDMFKKIKHYRDKLANIKHEMIMLHELSTKLKKRALKLEQQKQREALEKVHQRENEELLIGKPHPT